MRLLIYELLDVLVNDVRYSVLQASLSCFQQSLLSKYNKDVSIFFFSNMLAEVHLLNQDFLNICWRSRDVGVMSKTHCFTLKTTI